MKLFSKFSEIFYSERLVITELYPEVFTFVFPFVFFTLFMKFCQVNKYLKMLEIPFLAGLINFVMAENRGQLPAQELNLYF